MSFPYIIQGGNIIVVINNVPHTVSKTHLTYQKVKDAIIAGDWDLVKDVIEPKKMILNYGQGNVSVQGEKLFWRGTEFNNYLSTKIIEMLTEGFPVGPMVNFMENLMTNPSKRAVDETYKFLEKGNMPITEDGCFLAYKKVNTDYRDVHSNSVLNKPAHLWTDGDRTAVANSRQGKLGEVVVAIENGVTVVSMERNGVDDNRDNTCSSGLHFCSKDYLNSFSGSRVMIVKINPRDVVSIPSDYNDTKGRTCRYEVIGELGGDQEPEEAFTQPVQNNATGYVVPTPEPVVVVSQAYDKNGRPLSMTPNAIRKRESRARAAGQSSKIEVNLPGGWPFPK